MRTWPGIRSPNQAARTKRCWRLSRRTRSTVLIIGAGCTGLAMANSLKVSFGSRFRVLVVERRTIARHYKKPCSRDWLTYVRLDALENLIDDRVLRLLSRIGDQGFMGAPLSVFETLLLESCKALGVTFLFEQVDDYSSLIDLGADVVIDATGGRLGTQETGPPAPGPAFSERNLLRFGEAYRGFGITKSLSTLKAEVATVRMGNTLYPTIDGRPMQVPSFKVTNVPLRLYQPLLDFVRGRNQDSRFYIWPGMLKPAINSLLLIINLRRSEWADLTAALSGPMELFVFSRAMWPLDSTPMWPDC